MGDRCEAGSDSARALDRIVAGIREEIGCDVEVGVICGSGLEGVASILERPMAVRGQDCTGARCPKFGDWIPPLYWGMVDSIFTRAARRGEPDYRFEFCLGWAQEAFS